MDRQCLKGRCVFLNHPIYVARHILNVFAQKAPHITLPYQYDMNYHCKDFHKIEELGCDCYYHPLFGYFNIRFTVDLKVYFSL